MVAVKPGIFISNLYILQNIGQLFVFRGAIAISSTN
jgi:hypothetical protein